MPNRITPPIAPEHPIAREHHGHHVTDPYEWMRDTEASEFIEYLEAENAWTDHVTAPLGDLAEELYQDVYARTQQTDRSVPTLRTHQTATGPQRFWYYGRTVEGSQYGISCRVPASDTTMPDLFEEIEGEQVLLDANLEAEGTEFFSLGTLSVSPDGRLLAYGVDTLGNERYTLRFRDLTTGEELGDVIDDTAGPVAWSGNDTIYYLRADEAWRPHKAFRHVLGADEDTLVFTEPDEKFWMSIGNSTDERWVMLGLGSKLTTEMHMLDTQNPDAGFCCIRPREQGLTYEVEVAGDRLLILHDQDDPDFSLAQAPLPGKGDTTSWTEVIAPQKSVRLVDVDAHTDHVIVELRRDGRTEINLMTRDADGALLPGQDIEFDEPVRTVSALGAPDYDSPTFRIAYTSMVTPPMIMEVDVATGERTVLKQKPVLDHPSKGSYNPDDYVQERLWATAEDGTRVPISVVRRRDVPLDGTAPALLYGYGSYEICNDPGFSIMRLSLLERGHVFAIAHVRGGGEMGRAWYDEGKQLCKRNTFTDFIACARHLIAEGYTSPDRLAAEGGSAGGLLMGAVVNLSPETFAAVHAAVPFVDTLTTILKPELPLTVTEWEEWGDPLHDAEVYEYMASYTPYENIEAVQHPAILATTSFNDTRVSVVEPAKWVARLRATSQNAPEDVLLKCEMVAGHGGVSGRYRAWREAAFELAWIIDRTGGTHRE
ncbi:S9 family peptidase [Propioniferax innocua]|uniref:Oligopeptidase B n=1 Tax=Propioniferax innocua TaxID=1753 RepID=A0A542ZQT4_9ACTN|nr:S9 family peptidase [Propioniferax innocua]TQL62646.1 oligopeptidase B [Propioniferax innocua]